MISAQSIIEKRFEKAVFGGFEIRGVEDYMEELASEFSAMQKENIALKQKLKEINDKNEEYRTVENSMRKALISAQNIANEMVEKAKEERDKILNEASEIAHEQINTYRKQISQEQNNLQTIQDRTSKFVSTVTAFYEKQIKETTEFSREMPAIHSKSEVDNLFEEFTLDLSKENAQKLDKIADEKISYTNDILEKIKRETLNPHIVSDLAQDDLKVNYIKFDENKEAEDLKISENTEIKVEEEKRQSKFDIFELEFGEDFKNKTQY